MSAKRGRWTPHEINAPVGRYTVWGKVQYAARPSHLGWVHLRFCGFENSVIWTPLLVTRSSPIVASTNRARWTLQERITPCFWCFVWGNIHRAARPSQVSCSHGIFVGFVNDSICEKIMTIKLSGLVNNDACRPTSRACVLLAVAQEKNRGRAAR